MSTHPDPAAGLPPTLDAGGRTPAYRRKRVWIGALTAAVAVAVTVTALTTLFWPGYPALEYRPLASTKAVTLAPVAPVSSRFADTAIIGDRAYFAGVSEAGVLGVVAADVGAGAEVWRSDRAGSAERWERMVALPVGVALFTDRDSTTGTRRIAMLGADRGDLLWQRSIDDDDNVLFSGDTAVLVDRGEKRLLGLSLATGKARWEQPDVPTGSSARTRALLATTTADLAGPARVPGAAASPDMDDDQRIVQINADRSVRVLDADSGDVLVPPRPGVADTDDEVIAHNGRLIVPESVHSSQRIVVYDLAKLDEPRVLYSAPNDVRITHLTSCGAERVCWVETTRYDAKTTRVAGANAAEGGDLWHLEVPNTETLVPVGEALLAGQNTSPPAVALIDAKGKQVWREQGAAARLDAGNLLRFSKDLSAYPEDPALYGEHLGDEAVPLGALSRVRSQTCSWNTSVIACVADETFVLQRFAE